MQKMPKIQFTEKIIMHSIKRTIKKRKKGNLKATVKKMMVMMNPSQDQPSSSSDSSANPNIHNLNDFLSSGRTGRRNALPDILSDHSLVTSSELPSQLEGLSTKDNEFDPNNPSTSKQTESMR
ncbi:cAMP-dependent protein kinase inhibitor beta-like [Coccinella septempunctata]|uniref:cAMP-dependent protein kinase inhibitor beta-like n=1 Tax=Coccinella septempunctata TaxID=41139 RepID=UPI001D06ACE4|nr:cAMP-dependent protein kinase inhibitor beta-like [Coccinella septempunctata]